MVRPEYGFREKSSRWSKLGSCLLLALIIGILLGGELNGWWQLLPAGEPQPETETAVASEIQVAAAGTQLPTPEPTPTIATLSLIEQAPLFALPDLFDDDLLHIMAEYRGRPLILNFWASWCVPCRVEMPALQQAYEANEADGLVVLGINQTYVDELDLAREFVNELELTFPNARDDKGRMSTEWYRVIGLPTSVFVTPSGEVALVKIGQMTDDQITSYSRQLIAGESLTP